MTRYILTFTILLIFCFHKTNAQDKIHLSGLVMQMNQIKPVPYTTIHIQNTKNGVIAGPRGLFHIEVEKGDTLVFTAVGWRTTYFAVSDTLTETSYSIIQKMPKDTIKLKAVEINSWPSLDQFNRTFTEEKGFDKEYPIAQKNASPLLDQIDYSKEIDMKNYEEMNGRSFTNVYPNAHIPLNDVLNPKRWDNLVENWKSGKHR